MKEKFLKFIKDYEYEFNWLHICRDFYIETYENFPQISIINPRDTHNFYPITSRIDVKKTIEKIMSTFEDSCLIEYEEDLYIILGKDFIVCNVFIICSDKDKLKLIRGCIVTKEGPLLSILSNDLQADKTTTVRVKETSFNEVYYNADLPDNKIKDLLYSDKRENIVLYGNSGTGKTHYIKSLITKYQDLDFYLLNVTTLYYLLDPGFINFLINNRNAVYIIEDCETEIIDSKNSILKNFVNLFKGIVESNYKSKFIFIFNSLRIPVNPEFNSIIDLSYKFDTLDVDRCNLVLKSLGKTSEVSKSTLLGDLFKLEDNTTEIETNRVGF